LAAQSASTPWARENYAQAPCVPMDQVASNAYPRGYMDRGPYAAQPTTQAPVPPAAAAQGQFQTVGYQGPAIPPAPVAPAGPQAYGASSASPQPLLTMLHDSVYPSHREWAAEKLALIDWRTSPDVVQALLVGCREDPAATVRASCIRSIAKMGVNTVPAVNTLQALRSDPDPRVQQEVEQALNVLTPGQTFAPAIPAPPVNAEAPAPGR